VERGMVATLACSMLVGIVGGSQPLLAAGVRLENGEPGGFRETCEHAVSYDFGKRSASRLRGRAILEDGKESSPIEGIQIAVRELGGSGVRHVLSDARGEFDLGGLEAGKYSVWTCLDGFDEIRFELEIGPESRFEWADLYVGLSESGGRRDVVMRESDTDRGSADGVDGSAAASAASGTSPWREQCGSPLEHSDAYSTPDELEGAVVGQVDAASSVELLLTDGTTRRISLGGVEGMSLHRESGRLAREFLANLVLHRKVRVLLYGYDPEGPSVGGRLMLERTGEDVNLAMLQTGIARFGASEYLGSYERCIYRLAAEQAEREKRGIWGK
jgi:endonuclease YncB( thermonuclease family)